MHSWINISKTIDRVMERLGDAIAWLALAMVLIGAFNAIARYFGKMAGLNLSSNALIELQWYLFSVLFLLGAAYTLKCGAHVRVDVIYSRVSGRTRAWINLLGAILFLFPFSVLMVWTTWSGMLNSWEVWEVSPDPGGLPRYPLKTLAPIAFLLVMVQGVSEVIKNIARLAGHMPYEAPYASEE